MTVFTVSLLSPIAATAGTLSSATFTTAGTGYAVTSAANTRYDYGFTTATAATVSRVSATVPAGTNTYAPRYLALSGTTGNFATAPASAASSVAGVMDIRTQATLASWTGEQRLVSQWVYGNYKFSFGLFGGNVSLVWSNDGTSQISAYGPVTGWANNSTHWLRATFVPDNGSGGNTETLYSSTDGTTWTQMATATFGYTTSLYNSTAPVMIGATDTGGSYANVNGKVLFASVATAVNGTTTSPSTCTSTSVAFCFNPSTPTVAQAAAGTWTSSSTNAESWFVTRTAGATPPADIASDLTVSSVIGLPAGGTASYRLIDGAVVYVLPSATPIGAGTTCTFGVAGFTNTATPGTYASTITTFNGSGSIVDNATTNGLTFAPASNTTNVSATIDPTFTFVVTGNTTACNGESNYSSSAGSASGIALGHVTTATNVSGGQTLTVGSNAGSGFAVYIRGAQASQNLRSTGHNWSDVAGTYIAPTVLGSGEAFGYTYKDSTSGTSVTNPNSAKFAAVDSTNRAVVASTSASAGSGCVSFDSQTSSITPAGSYSATIIYTAVPTF